MIDKVIILIIYFLCSCFNQLLMMKPQQCLVIQMYLIRQKVNDFTNMLKDVRENVSQMIKEGEYLEEIITSQSTSEYDEIYQDHTSRQPEDFVSFI